MAVRHDKKQVTESTDFEAFKHAWLDYPSQDNEGYQPDRGGFKCGWFAALDYRDEHPHTPDLSRIERAVDSAWEKNGERR